MRPLALLVGVIIAVVGLVGIVYPALLVALFRNSVTPPALYGVAVIRVVMGSVFIRVSRVARAPRLLRAIGAIVIVAGVATPLLGADRAHAMMSWGVAQGPVFIRLVGGLAVLLAAVLIRAIGLRSR
ncbi:MAG: hypothetical protein ND807_08465, partial [Vicinamibacterales bacterium]|nr:hypothetical protein [Vicinamibacterales bacterium]